MGVYDALIAAQSDSEVPPGLRDYLDSALPGDGENGRDDAERPAKRRKGSEAMPQTPEEGDVWRDPIVLSRVIFDLTFAGSCTAKDSPPPGRIERPVVLYECPKATGSGRANAYSIDLRVPFAAGSLAEFEVNADISPKTLEVLERSCRARVRFGKRKFARSLCSISRDRDGAGTLRYQLDVQIVWRNSLNLGQYSLDRSSDGLLEFLAPHPTLSSSSDWTPRDFYDSVHVPPTMGKEAEEAHAIKIDTLNCQLYPFQQRTVSWMLRREGVNFHGERVGQQSYPSKHGFFAIAGIDRQEIFVNHWLGIATTNRRIFEGQHTQVRGGLLAEEMGLGKTVEIISLLLMNTRPSQLRGHSSPSSPVPSKATLIISPISIQQQWKSEINNHAPGLKVMVYDGIKHVSKKTSDEEMVKILLAHDVVLASYGVLSGEIYFAGTEPERSLRHQKQYKKRKSPLVQIDWWRCVLDECQMVESGVTQAAKVANQIPRQNAWAVSGTPLKKDAKDLLGLLVFLRLEPYWYSQTLWLRLISRFKPIFKELFAIIALRHSKEQIKADIQLPPQKRIVITMPFTQIEEQHYANMYQEMCDDCGLSLEGAPLADDWNPDSAIVTEKMRTWLARLRQSVLHPEVGERNRRALGHSEGPLRTVAEVLKVMTEQNELSIRTEERLYLVSKLRRGQILEHARSTQEALFVWQDVLAISTGAVNECREGLLQESDTDDEEINASASKTTHPKTQEHKDEDEDSGQSFQNRTGPLRLRLRSALELQHAAMFFVGNAYFQIKTNEDLTKPESDRFHELEKLESDAYDEAKEIRKEILAETQNKARALMESAQKRVLVEIPDFKELVSGGIESRDLLERVEYLCDALTIQAVKIGEWRTKMLGSLLKPLVDDQDDANLQGDEYETSTKEQDNQYAFQEAIRAAVADRHDALTGQENFLIKRDMDMALQQSTNGHGASPELMIKLLKERQAMKPTPRMGSFRGVISELRGLRTDLERQPERGSSRAKIEVDIVNRALAILQADLAKHTKNVTELEKEVETFRDVMNARLGFYRQLQTISDSVAPYEEELSDDATQAKLAQMRADEIRSETKTEMFKSRGRYLRHLRCESDAQDGAKKCIICQDEIQIGVLLSCGHQFCKDCLKHWYSSHRTCPVCKRKLHQKTDFHQITYKPQELTAQEETSSRSSEQGSDIDSQPPATSLYSGINSSSLAQIKNIDVDGSFGTKIDTLARHILFLRTFDPGAKSIIFSQFRDFLDIISRAFTRFKISFASIDDVKKSGIERFKHDPSVECFFLHAKAHASGLNLVMATHVFLCEPLINTALELQAIARVHRIGQHCATTVYMYLVEDTVEKAIYDISVTRRLAHISRASQNPPAEARARQKQASREVEEADIEAANSLEMQEASIVQMLASGRGGGEVVGKNDLWDCLFGARQGAGRRLGEEAERTIAGFLGAEAAEGREMVGRGGRGKGAL